MSTSLDTPDRRFFNHLAALSSGAERISALHNYKLNSYALNGGLKSVAGVDTQAVKSLLSAMRATPTNPLTVFRMTSDAEFLVNLVRFISEQQIFYPAFASASDNRSTAFGFTPPFGRSLLLEIQIPPGFPVALMEGGSQYSGESEVLIPAGTGFTLIDGPHLESSGGAGRDLWLMTLSATIRNPLLQTVANEEFFEF